MFLDKRKYYTKEYNIFELLDIFHNWLTVSFNLYDIIMEKIY